MTAYFGRMGGNTKGSHNLTQRMVSHTQSHSNHKKWHFKKYTLPPGAGMPEGFCIFCRTNNIVLSKQEIASCKVIRVNIVALIFCNIQELSYPEICLKCWEKTTSTYRFDRLSKRLALSPEMEKDYSRWSNTEAQAIINICTERHKVKILPLFGGFSFRTEKSCFSEPRD